jgi:hypothetical protein
LLHMGFVFFFSFFCKAMPLTTVRTGRWFYNISLNLFHMMCSIFFVTNLFIFSLFWLYTSVGASHGNLPHVKNFGNQVLPLSPVLLNSTHLFVLQFSFTLCTNHIRYCTFASCRTLLSHVHFSSSVLVRPVSV